MPWMRFGLSQPEAHSGHNFSRLQAYYTHDAPETHSLIKTALANGYRNWRFGSNLKPASRLGILVAFLLPAQREGLEVGLRHLPKVDDGAKLLDVGCGNGIFLDLARKVGWKVFGADFDPVCVEAARKKGLKVRKGGIRAFA